MEDIKDKKFELIQAIIRVHHENGKDIPSIIEDSRYGEELLKFGFTEEELNKINNLKIGESYTYHIDRYSQSLVPNDNKIVMGQVKRVDKFYVRL